MRGSPAMDNSFLIRVNRYLKKSRPLLDTETVCDVFRNGTFLEIGFMSKRCRNDANGACIMCDYGAISGTKDSSLYKNEMNKILKEHQGIEYLLLCSNGSIMDHSQIPEDTFKTILMQAQATEIPHIIIETHYDDVNAENLQLIKQLLPSKDLTLELGLETVNQSYQDTLIMKHINMSAFEKKVALIQSYGIHVDVNILLGLPFLSAQEQYTDTLNAISWAFAHNCNPVLFPVNIKPFTLLMHMYQNGFYKPVSHWLLILLLDSIAPEKLSRLTISYYGNREETYDNADIHPVFPGCCPVCEKPLQDFYSQFFQEDDSYRKKELIKNILEFHSCDCLKEQKELLNKSDNGHFEKKYEDYERYLHKKFDSIL